MSQRRSALGRGLGALISSPPARANTDPESAPAASTRADPTLSGVDTEKGMPGPDTTSVGPSELEIARIDPNPDQPRREFDPEALDQLARSIGQHGVLQPVVVRRAGDRYELVMGERRFRASQLAGRSTIPAVILDVDSADRLELAIVENVQRQDLNPIELAHAYQALADAGHTQEEIGRKVSMDRSSVANHLRLLDLSRVIQSDVESNRLTMGHAKALLQVSELDKRELLRARILREALSVRATEKAARELSGAPSGTAGGSRSGAAGPSTLDPDTRAFVERIERRLQTKVAIHPGAKGTGKLEISYFNLEDLERIGGMLLGEER